MTEITFGTAEPFQGYGPGFFRVAGHVLRGAALVSPWGAGPWGGLTDTETPLTLAGRIDVLLLGMGAEIAHAPPAFVAALDAAGIGVDVMASATACRTYNLLLGEGRRIAAAVLPVVPKDD